MKQIYDFERYNPPALNENMLHNELEKRKVQRQTILLAVAGILVQIVMLMFGFLNAGSCPIITIICLGYVFVSVTGGSVIAVVFARKGGLAL
ncbi:MAG: hypothetical protein IJZ53_00070 [Tyzzerella sp.]|nr:hypothetical protein [Tyzzerella sp.]